MSPRENVTRATAGGRAYLDLQKLARTYGRRTHEIFQLYALEGFLARASASRYAEYFILKGGVLLAAYDDRRPTRDIDFLARQISGDVDEMLAVLKEVAATPVEDDGLIIHHERATGKTIRDESGHPCMRARFTGSMSAAEFTFHVDVSTGDPVWPGEQVIIVPGLLGRDVRIRGYPLAMVFAEKITATLDLGQGNTRWRDFGDLYTLPGRHDADGSEACRALEIVSAHNGVERRPLRVFLDGFSRVAQRDWSAWLRGQEMGDVLPESFTDVLAEVIHFADPVITGEADGLRWHALSRQWMR